MKLFISVDMEGTTGLERLEEISGACPGSMSFASSWRAPTARCTACFWRIMGRTSRAIDDVAQPGDYARPDLGDIIGDDDPLNEIGPKPAG